jgi:hypothetical protein
MGYYIPKSIGKPSSPYSNATTEVYTIIYKAFSDIPWKNPHELSGWTSSVLFRPCVQRGCLSHPCSSNHCYCWARWTSASDERRVGTTLGPKLLAFYRCFVETDDLESGVWMLLCNLTLDFSWRWKEPFVVWLKSQQYWIHSFLVSLLSMKYPIDNRNYIEYTLNIHMNCSLWEHSGYWRISVEWRFFHPTCLTGLRKDVYQCGSCRACRVHDAVSWWIQLSPSGWTHENLLILRLCVYKRVWYI